VHRAATLEELYDFAKALAYVPPPDGPRMLIVTSSGGSAIIATDVAEEEGLRVTPLPPALGGKLREILPPHCIVGNPLDLTGDTDAVRYRKVLEAADGEYDVVMAIFGDPIPGASEVIRPGRCELVAYLGGAEVERAERLLLHEKKIAVFPTPERAVKALSCHVRFRRDRFPLSPEETGHGEEPSARAVTPSDSMSFLSRAGFPLTRFRPAGSEEEAVAAAKGIGFPVAVKMNSPDVTHKSDAGGVFLDVADDAGVRAAFRAIRDSEGRLGARAGGALVCAMAPAGHEVIVGVTKDPQFGHAVMFGLGGIFVEVMKDVTFRVVPVSEKDAAEMISGIRGYGALTGTRGKPAADLDALRALLLQVSAFLSAHPEVEEMDLNPVIVHERGLTIADARVVLGA
jgi:acetyltransferase